MCYLPSTTPPYPIRSTSSGPFAPSTVTTAPTACPTGGQTVDAGQVETSGGIVGTRRPGGAPWQPLLGTDPTGTWELQFEDTPPVRALFTSGTVQDVVLAMSVAGTTQPWP